MFCWGVSRVAKARRIAANIAKLLGLLSSVELFGLL
jgi:hypothetical protein